MLYLEKSERLYHMLQKQQTRGWQKQKWPSPSESSVQGLPNTHWSFLICKTQGVGWDEAHSMVGPGNHQWSRKKNGAQPFHFRTLDHSLFSLAWFVLGAVSVLIAMAKWCHGKSQCCGDMFNLPWGWMDTFSCCTGDSLGEGRAAGLLHSLRLDFCVIVHWPK